MNLAQIRTQIANVVQSSKDALASFDAIFSGVGNAPKTSATVTPAKKRGRPEKAKAVAKTSAKASKAPKAKAKKVAKAKSATPHPASRALGNASEIDAALVGALRNAGEPLGKAALLVAAGLAKTHEARASVALARLKNDGAISMNGSRRGATYELSTRSKSNGASTHPVVETTANTSASAEA
jgi:CCR4-NOT transcriptional regulation complex NOT5 subunit